MYITLTSVDVKWNPVKKVQFWYWAMLLMQEADGVARYGETRAMNGKRMSLTVWRNPEGPHEFISSDTPQRVLHKMGMNDICKSTRVYSYQTDHLPSWEEVALLLDMNGRTYFLS